MHLEVMSNMSSEEFLMGFRRFIACRGTPVELLSDNAKQFKLASEVVKQAWREIESQDDEQSYVSEKGFDGDS